MKDSLRPHVAVNLWALSVILMKLYGISVKWYFCKLENIDGPKKRIRLMIVDRTHCDPKLEGCLLTASYDQPTVSEAQNLVK